eukprot:1154088-Pelagomonas_calceolata.AAC.4
MSLNHQEPPDLVQWVVRCGVLVVKTRGLVAVAEALSMSPHIQASSESNVAAAKMKSKFFCSLAEFNKYQRGLSEA